MENVALPAPTTPRRRVVEFLLGGGVLASVISFVYPVLRYLIPPRVVDLGGDEVVASKVGDFGGWTNVSLPGIFNGNAAAADFAAA